MTPTVAESMARVRVSTARERAPAAARCVWILIKDPHNALAIAEPLRQTGWRIDGIANGLAGARRLLADSERLPDVVISGLHFDDGDGLQLIRLLARRAAPPSLFIASHQQRAVIKAAVALADACGVPLAGVAEQPVNGHSIGTTLATFERRREPLRRPAPPRRLQRDELLSMFDRGAVYPWLQPKVRIDSREVIGFEALMRAHDEAGELVMPDRLVSSLAEHGLLDEATMRMAKHTVEFVASCLADGLAISASINVSMLSLTNLAFCHELAKAVEQFDLDPSWITIEITETDAMSDLAQVIENTARIRMLGFNLAIDDFGTAYASLFQLSRIPFSELKIERAFTSGVERDSDKQAVVRACAQLGRSLGLQVVAEGVETQAEFAFVRESGCTQIQGYLVARPMPVADAQVWLRGLDDLRFELPASS